MRIRFSALLCLIVVLLAACGQSTSTGGSAPQATTAPAQATTAPAAQATTAPAAQPTAAGSQGGGQTAAPTDQGACTPENASKEAANTDLVIATGGTGGVYYPYGGGLARILSSKLSGTTATAEVTSASVDNMKLIHAGDADLAFTLADTAFDAFAGRAAFQETGAVSVCAIAVLYTNYMHVVATADSGIKSLADLKGKRVSVGSAGSGTEVIADRMMAAAGLDPQVDITRDNLSVAESVAAIKDGKIDAFFWSGGLPTGAVTDLVSTPNLQVTFVPNADVVGQMSEEYGPLYFEATMPAGSYTGQDQDVTVVGVSNILAVNASMPEQQVQDILATFFDNLEEVHAIHPEAKKLTPETAVEGSSIPFHPGAISYYTGKGVMQP